MENSQLFGRLFIFWSAVRNIVTRMSVTMPWKIYSTGYGVHIRYDGIKAQRTIKKEEGAS